MKKLCHVTDEQWEQVCDFNKMILEDFLTNSTELSPKTRKAYESNLKIWFVWVKDNLGNKQQLDIKPLEYKKFQNWLVNRECSSSDVNNKRAAISSLNGYIEIYYHDDYPTFRNFINKSIKRPPKAFVHEKEPLSKEEFQHLVDVLTEKEDWEKVAYLLFTYDTGCRRAESRQLLKSIVNAEPIVKKSADGKNEIVMYQTHPIRCKGAGTAGKVRRLFMGETSMNAIKKWLEVRGEDDCPYVFIVKYAGEIRQVSETTFNNWSTAVFEPIVGRRFTPHAIRRSRATAAVCEEGKDIEQVKNLLGHNDVSTTQIYVIREETTDEMASLF